jgi:hypothetical protein
MTEREAKTENDVASGLILELVMVFIEANYSKQNIYIYFSL